MAGRRPSTVREAQAAPPAGAPASDAFDRIYAVVAQVPPGRVTTYGHVARAVGLGRAARTVGWALKAVAHLAIVESAISLWRESRNVGTVQPWILR